MVNENKIANHNLYFIYLYFLFQENDLCNFVFFFLLASFGGQIIEAARDQGARIVDGVKYWYQSIKERIFGVNDNPEESALRELPDPLILLTASNATALDSYKNVVDKWDSPLHLNIGEFACIVL